VVSGATPKRVQRFGPELWERRSGQDWSLWDLWFCVIPVRDHDGDLDALAQTFIDAMRQPSTIDCDASEAKRSHLFDLRARLAGAGVTAADLADADVLADKRVSSRAREKVSAAVIDP
jgi:hypothetical protein